ncbi:MAG: NUDIX hydrolase [Bacteroidia bacterium]|nr:NUDIX hydrolase [Bacteroidia bacterium]
MNLPHPQENPWQIKSSKLIYENPWIRVDEHQVINPSGNPGIYGVVHFQSNAIGVVPYENGEIWMVGQYRFPLEEYQWEIPEGGGPFDEDPLEAAKRELKEETGLTAKNWEPLLEMNLSNSVSDEWGIVYLATGLESGIASPEETEDLLVRKVSLELAYEMVEKRIIRDSLTVGAIYKMMLLKLQGKLP